MTCLEDKRRRHFFRWGEGGLVPLQEVILIKFQLSLTPGLMKPAFYVDFIIIIIIVNFFFIVIIIMIIIIR